jgi:hypothetical protein
MVAAAKRAGVVAVAVLACLAGSAGAGTQSNVRATLVAPHALAVFVGKMNGSSLSWRLTHHGLGASAPRADLRAAGRSFRLCAPCAQSASGTVALTAAAARAAKSGKAYVRLQGARATVSGKLALGTVPTLQVIGVADGTTLQLPAVVHFAVTGYRVAPGAGKVLAYSGGQMISVEQGSDGSSVTLPDDKMLTGRRDLTFALADATGQPLANVESHVQVYRVLLAGRR